MNFNKTIAGLMAATSILTTQVPALAANLSTVSQKANTTILQLVEPRYTYISQISAGLEINNGTASCSGSFSAYYDYTANFEIELQYSYNQVTWYTLKTWTSSYSAEGPHMLNKTYRNLPTGRAYRVVSRVEIKGKTADCTSPIKQL